VTLSSASASTQGTFIDGLNEDEQFIASKDEQFIASKDEHERFLFLDY
jgi:hypothetical protein